ncbi:MAG: AlpA family phage regulatory protein [Zoogloea sp.]|nr:AlpA family phage regulatory protein [Zoogloea sp.]
MSPPVRSTTRITSTNEDIMSHTPLPATGFVRQAQLLPLVPFSAATLWRKVKDRTFPAPVKLSERITAWKVEEVRAWIENPMHFRGAK